MFTGIVTNVGRVAANRGGRLTIEDRAVAVRLAPGSSVAVNGACLTVIEVTELGFTADVVPETRRRTNLGALAPADLVNLELPLSLNGGLDGHLVQGHVDARAAVLAVRGVGQGREIEIELPGPLEPFVAEKGSIAVDGISLTVAGLDARASSFTVALIPHTLASTGAGGWAPGRTVNLEVDVVARYLHRLMTIRDVG